MALFTMDYKLAMAAGQDAAMKRMRGAGRKAWNQTDYSEAVRVFNRLWPMSEASKELRRVRPSGPAGG